MLAPVVGQILIMFVGLLFQPFNPQITIFTHSLYSQFLGLAKAHLLLKHWDELWNWGIKMISWLQQCNAEAQSHLCKILRLTQKLRWKRHRPGLSQVSWTQNIIQQSRHFYHPKIQKNRESGPVFLEHLIHLLVGNCRLQYRALKLIRWTTSWMDP